MRYYSHTLTIYVLVQISITILLYQSLHMLVTTTSVTLLAHKNFSIASTLMILSGRRGCGPLNTCCSFNNPPWFMKQLPTTTDDNIEMKLCSDQERSNEDIVFETLELYVR